MIFLWVIVFIERTRYIKSFQQSKVYMEFFGVLGKNETSNKTYSYEQHDYNNQCHKYLSHYSPPSCTSIQERWIRLGEIPRCDLFTRISFILSGTMYLSRFRVIRHSHRHFCQAYSRATNYNVVIQSHVCLCLF